MKKVLICGAGGFIGSHLAKRLKRYGWYVIGADIKEPKFLDYCDEFYLIDLSDSHQVKTHMYDLEGIDEVYQLAADMGGAEYIFVGDNDLDIMTHSLMINVNIIELVKHLNIPKVFYSSSACVYAEHNQQTISEIDTRESSAYPAAPDSEYGWEKLMSERLYKTLERVNGIQVRIARFHNIFGPYSEYNTGREKAPAALCRKVAMADSEIEIFGDGEQARSFLYIEDCLDAVEALMLSEFSDPINIGSSRTITINDLADMIINFSRKNINVKHIDGPVGVPARTSDNTLFDKVIGEKHNYSLEEGIELLYTWVRGEVQRQTI